MSEPTFFSWSGGKDSALAYYYAGQGKNLEIKHLLTTISKEYQRISMHGVRKELLEAQAESIGAKLTVVELSESAGMDAYNALMKENMDRFKKMGMTTVVFGDIFLEDLRAYREKQIKKADLKAAFPLWKKDTIKVAAEFISLGFKATITCIDESKLDTSFVGREYNHEFLHDLPDGVDPCGENGEFHSFVHDGPIFSTPVKFEKGRKICREYPKTDKKEEEINSFWYIDLLVKREK
jgi:uncharacterized protein (TIGR00290 family)